MANLVEGIPRQLTEGEVLVVYTVDRDNQRSVIERDLHNITPQEAKQHPKLVADAMYDEVTK